MNPVPPRIRMLSGFGCASPVSGRYAVGLTPSAPKAGSAPIVIAPAAITAEVLTNLRRSIVMAGRGGNRWEMRVLVVRTTQKPKSNHRVHRVHGVERPR